MDEEPDTPDADEPSDFPVASVTENPADVQAEERQAESPRLGKRKRVN